jgi:Asp-tRNA(Asn)/Glu-tRNA(Gln) amidotransferase A subunit family amidase
VPTITDEADMPTRFNSSIFADTPTIPLDATAVKTLRSVGALVFGKTETTQFASTTTGGPCANPHNTAHTPGGSSSGSAAAVAAFHVPLAIGTQTGGSIVRPASFCGIWGFKPTWGTVSTEGMSRYSTTCDTVGYFARSIDDLDLISSVYAQRPFPSPHLREPFPPTAKIAMLQTHVWPKAGPGLHAAWQRTHDLLLARGYTPEAASLPSDFSNMTQWHANLMAHESRAQFQGHYLTNKAALDHVIVDIYHRGATLSPDTIRETYNGVARLRELWDEWAAQYDLIVTPSTTDSAPEGLGWTGDACFNAMWTALHAPSVNVPGLRASGGLPIGLTVVGARWTDEEVLRGAAMLGEVLAKAE